MALLTVDKFGGIVPKIYDPRLLPAGKGQVAKNCRFDHGGARPLGTDATAYTPTNPGTLKSIYLYDVSGSYWLAWTLDINVARNPIANDTFKRLYWTGDGTPKMSTFDLITTGGTNYPMANYDLGIPAPADAPSIALGAVWAAHDPTVNGKWGAVAYGSSKFVAIGLDGTIMTSPDGISPWTSRVCPLAAEFTCGIAYSGSLFVAFIGPNVMTSPDGITWTAQTVPVVTRWGGVGYGNNLFVLVDSNGTVGATSIDGVTWSSRTLPSAQWAGVAYGNNVFVAIASGGVTATSPDGVTWTGGTFPSIQSGPIAFGNGLFVVLPNNTAVPYTSPDGATWTPQILPQSGLWSSLAYGLGMFVSVSIGSGSGNSNIGAISFDGINWITADLPSSDMWLGVAFGNNTFVAVGAHGAGGSPVAASPKVATIGYTNPTLIESRAYVIRYVSAYGEVGPPSPVSAVISVLPDQQVNITGIDGAPAGNHNIANVDIFRLNQDANGNEQYQYVGTVAIGTTTFLDTVANAALGEVLESTLWDPPPAGMIGLIPLPNAVFAGYVGNVLCLSVPGFPHAWPLSYQKVTDRPIMGLGAYGMSVVVLTDSIPYLATGTDPSNFTMESMKEGYGCMSKRSIVDMSGTTVYASTEGLTAIAPNNSEVLTKELFSPEDWRDRYNPSTITAFMWEEKYVGFYDNGAGGAGFIFEPKTQNWVDLDFYATAGYRDPKTGILYLQVGADIVSFATVTNTPRTMDNLSRRNVHKLTMFTKIKVLAEAYPVSIDIIFPTLGQTLAISVTSSTPQSIPMANAMVDTTDVRVYGTKGATAVYLASELEEIPL